MKINIMLWFIIGFISSISSFILIKKYNEYLTKGHLIICLFCGIFMPFGIFLFLIALSTKVMDFIEDNKAWFHERIIK